MLFERQTRRMSCKAIHALERAGAAKARSSVQAQTADILQMIKLKSKLTARPTIRRRHTSMQVRILRHNLTGTRLVHICCHEAV